MTFVQIAPFDWSVGRHEGNSFEKNFSDTMRGMKLKFCSHAQEISLHIMCFFISVR